jgi:hypothetical protein
MDARTAEFQKSLARVAGQQWRDIELGLAVKALVAGRDVTAKQTVHPNDFRFFSAEAIELLLVDDKEMIAEFIEGTDVPPCQRGALVGNSVAFFVKDLEPQPLRLANLPARRRQPDFVRAKLPQHRR